MRTMIPPDPEELVERLIDATECYEFSTFLLGFGRPDDYHREAHEKVFRAVKIATGEELLRRWRDRSIDFCRPDLRIDIRPDDTIDLVTSPLFFAARYRKLSRDIPSSRWVHHRCRGKGCDSCSWTGTLCGPSVQELVAGPIIRRTDAEETFLHGLGREDTDARMLGTGRPFILEVKRPKRRSVDLRDWEKEVRREARGLAEIACAATATRPDVTLLKEEPADKTYRAWIDLDGMAPADAADRVERLAGRTIRQLSPTRVKHRRGETVVREKSVVSSLWLGRVGDAYVWEVRTSSGTYIKELVSGDDGRTRPSVAELLGVPARCRLLDVLEIHWTPPWENKVQDSEAGEREAQRCRS